MPLCSLPSSSYSVLRIPSLCFAFSQLVLSTPRPAKSHHSLSFPPHHISMPYTALATLPSPFHCDRLQAFPFPCSRYLAVHCLCMASHFIAETFLIHSSPCRRISIQLNSKALLFHTECRLSIHQHVLSTLCRNDTLPSILCHSKQFASSPLPNSAAHTFPPQGTASHCPGLSTVRISIARHIISIPLPFIHFESTAKLCGASATHCVPTPTLFLANPLPCHPNPFRAIP